MKERDIPRYEERTYWTPEQVIQFYTELDTPLPRGVIEYHLTKLIGTSFLGVAFEAIAKQCRRIAGWKASWSWDTKDLSLVHPLIPGNFYAALSGMESIGYFTDQIQDQEKRASARATLQTMIPSFSPKNIYEYQTIRPDEMLVELRRTDDVFTDVHEDSPGYAYSHLSRQVLFFKKGVLLDGIEMASIQYYLPSGHGRLHSIMVEWLHETDYFINPERKVLSFVAPQLQRFNDHEQRSHTSSDRNFKV
jgi:hypothetical protein